MYINRSEVAFIALAAALATPCFAQSSTAPGGEGDLALEEVVITGSRLATGFDTPTPVTMVAAEDLIASVPNNMGEALAQLPSLAGSVQNTTSGQGSANSNTNGQNLLNLRQLGSNRTLVLLDGQRMGVTNVEGAVDINIIPQNLVKRVDVVTGGASASYGSDAVAGVVNFILDNQFEGFKFDVNYGQTAYNDAQNGKVSMAFGTHLSDRARVVGSLEYFALSGIVWGEDTGRDWHTNPVMSVDSGATSKPRWLLIPDTRSRYGTFGGTITAVRTPTPTNNAANCALAACASLIRQTFLPGGATQLLADGTNVFGNNAYVSGGGGSIVNQAFVPKDVERYGAFLHGEFDVNDHATLWGEASYNASETFNQAQVLQSQTTSAFRLYEDNAYMPAAVKSVLTASTVPGLQYIEMTRYSRDLGYNEVTGNVYVARFATGVKGSINDRWSYDTILGYQDTHQDLDVRTAIMRRLYAAADAVVHPTNNQIVCRSQWYTGTTATSIGTFVPGGTGLDPGCVPINVFGDGSVSEAAKNYVMGVNTADIDLKQYTVDLNLRGDFGDDITLGAGPISFASGMNYRRQTASRTVDPLSGITMNTPGPVYLGDMRTINPQVQYGQGGYSYYSPVAIGGNVTVTEGYTEFGVPLLKDLTGVKELSTTLAGRLTDYSQSGVENMWKLGLNWTINDSVRVRGTLSADTRAPTVIELFNTGQVSRGTYTLGRSGQNKEIGNEELFPEHAKTYTAGLVFNPAFLPGFQASVDWYKIELLGSIAPTASQDLIDGCAAGAVEDCSWITINSVPADPASMKLTETRTSDFIIVTNQLRNEPANSYTSGIDFDATFRTPVGPGELTMRLTGNYLLDEYNPDSNCTVSSTGKKVVDFVGAIGGCGTNPELKGRISARYDINRFGIYVQQRYIKDGVRNPNYIEGIDISDNTVPEMWYTDMTLTYKLPDLGGGAGEAYFNATNVFDKDPPPTNSGAGRSWVDPTEEGLYDVLGRRYTLGVRYKW